MIYQQPSYQQPSYQQPSYQQPSYQQPDSDTTSIKYDIMNGIKYGVITGIFIILIWYVWAMYVYRWSNDRIENMIIDKYKNKITNEFNNTAFPSVSNMFVSPDRTLVTATLLIMNKKDRSIIRSENIEYSLITDETKCKPFNTTNCLLV